MSVQKREKIACFGAPGSYSHEALYCHFGKSADIVFYDHFEDLVNRVGAGECRYGVLPVETLLPAALPKCMTLFCATTAI